MLKQDIQDITLKHIQAGLDEKRIPERLDRIFVSWFNQLTIPIISQEGEQNDQEA